MATTTPMALADMIVPELWQKYIIQESTVLTTFWQSGIVTDMSSQLGLPQADGGGLVHMPFFNDLTGNSEVVDDTGALSVAKTTTGQDVAVVNYRAKSYGGTDLAADLSGADPVPVIISRFGAFWARDLQDTLLASTAGAMACTGMANANVLDISGLAGSAAVFDGSSFIDAKFKLGDHAGNLQAIACHSNTYALMLKQNLIDFIKPSEGGEMIPTYMGHQVLYNDKMPVSGGVYTTYLYGSGAFGYGERMPKVPVEPWRDPLKFGGYSFIVNRRQYVLHPRGIKWVGTSSLATPSDTELATNTNWSLVYDPKLVRIVKFTHKNA